VRRQLLRDRLDLLEKATTGVAETTCCRETIQQQSTAVALPAGSLLEAVPSTFPAETDLAKCLYCAGAGGKRRRFLTINEEGITKSGNAYAAAGLKASAPAKAGRGEGKTVKGSARESSAAVVVSFENTVAGFDATAAAVTEGLPLDLVLVSEGLQDRETGGEKAPRHAVLTLSQRCFNAVSTLFQRCF